MAETLIKTYWAHATINGLTKTENLSCKGPQGLLL
jgi:hypothetical protein